MSAPNTDPDDKTPRHRGPLTGMKGVVIFVAILIVGMLIYLGTSFEGPTRVAPDSTGTEATSDGN